MESDITPAADNTPIREHDQRQTLKDWAPDDRPRERFVNRGRESMSDAELLAIIIGQGCRNYTALDLARELLTRCDQQIARLGQMEIKELQNIKGIGQAKAVCIAAALELGRRRREITPSPIGTALNNSQEIYKRYRHRFDDLQHEEFRILLLNRALRPIADRTIGVGGLHQAVADASKILREAIIHRASSMILMHNHPSGNLVPSDADRALTERIAKSSRLFGCHLVDHLIFSDRGYYSFADQAEPSLLGL
ncbi:MAG: RadC family protein [Bacteroidia bacterium]|jgi:DNA repair protein RadC